MFVRVTSLFVAWSCSVACVAAQEFDGVFHASTPAESEARGNAAMIRAAGEYNYLTGLGMVQHQEARRRNYENKLRATRAYFDAQLANREYRALLRGPRTTVEQARKWAKWGLPKRLAPEQWDPAAAHFKWPAVLRSSAFAAYRKRIEASFARRTAADSGIEAKSYLEISNAASDMQQALKERIRDYDATSYINAKHFVRSIAFEARFAVEPVGLAAR